MHQSNRKVYLKQNPDSNVQNSKVVIMSWYSNQEKPRCFSIKTWQVFKKLEVRWE